MKKLLLLLFIAVLSSGIYSQSKNFSRWSIWGEYGYNYLDADINQNITAIFPNSFREITYGGGLEYAFTPIWGLSVDYAYFPMKALNSIPASIEVNTFLHAASVNATINFTRWIFPETKSKFYLNGSIGLGYAYYEYFPIDLITNDVPDNVIKNDRGLQAGQAGSVPVTFSGEYNFSKPFSLGAKIHYRAYTKDNLEGVSNLNWKGVTNDYVAAATLFVRYKFTSIRKDHLRNIRWQDYQPDLGLTTALEAKNEIAALKTKVDDVDKKVGDIGKKVGKLEDKVNDLVPRVENLEKFIANDGPDTDGDGVPDIRDQDNNTPPNTPVDFWGRTLVVPVVDAKKATVAVGSYTETPIVYFDYDRIDLDNDALIAISKVGMRMLADPSLMVEVYGHTDFSGDMRYNQALSQRRAERVKKELIKVWEISADRIIASGKGRVETPKMKYRPSRRCEFYFSK